MSAEATTCGQHLDLSLQRVAARERTRERGFGRVAGGYFAVQAGGTLPVPL
jgi:hypothetical protein